MSSLARTPAPVVAPGRLFAVSAAIATVACLAVARTPCSAQQFVGTVRTDDPVARSPGGPRPAFNPATRPDVIDLESPLQRADLVVAAKLVEVTESKVVQGGRNVQVTQQYRFEPVRVVKGIFARDALLMTGADLGVYPFAAAGERLRPGQVLLILLARQGQHFTNCNPAATLGQSIPRLSGPDDPLLSAVDVLTAAARQRDRKARVQTLLGGLSKARGREAGPLLLALERRAVIVARNASSSKDVDGRETVVGHAVLPFLKSDSASLRELAAHTIGSVLEAAPGTVSPQGRSPARPAPTPIQVEAARAIDAALAAAGPDIASRVAMIDARGLAGGEWVGLSDGRQEQLRKSTLPRSPSNAEAAARYRAIARGPAPWRRDEVVAALPTEYVI